MSARSAAEHVGSIKDLMVEILARVPAKPVTRFKLVSKKFCSLISDPEFVQSHAKVNNYSSGMFLYTSNASHETDFFWLTETQSPPPSLTFLEGVFGEGYKVLILQSCSGLLLCRYSNNSAGRYDYSSGKAGDLLICNPSTKQYRKLPPPEREWSASNLYFAFDPSVSPHYKLVYPGSEGSSFRVEVYSSHNHVWRPLTEFKEFNMDGGGNIERYAHWRPISVNGERFHFDLKSEALVRIPESPSHPSTTEMDYSIQHSLSYSVMNDYDPSTLCVSLCHNKEDSSISILEKSQDFSKTVTKYRGNICDLTCVYPEMVKGKHVVRGLYGQCVKEESYKLQALGVVKGLYSQGEPELVLVIPGKIISYNFVKKTAKTLHNLANVETTEDVKHQFTTYSFIESLSSV